MRKTIIVLGSLMVVALLSCEKPAEVNTKSENVIRIKGSNTEFALVKDIADAFMKQNDQVKIVVDGGGSEIGIEAFLQGKIDVANLSRELNRGEEDLSRENGIEPVPVIFAVDAIALVTNSHLGIDSLSLSDVGNIFSGAITNWKQVGGPDREIHTYGRDARSGTHTFFREKVLHGENYVSSMKMYETYQSIVDEVKHDSCGVGYVSVGHIMDPNGKPNSEIWATYLFIDGGNAVSPYQVNAVMSGDYPLMRPLYQYTNNLPLYAIRDFIDFELSEAGQAIVKSHGFFPINDYHKEINRKKKEELKEL